MTDRVSPVSTENNEQNMKLFYKKHPFLEQVETKIYKVEKVGFFYKWENGLIIDSIRELQEGYDNLVKINKIEYPSNFSSNNVDREKFKNPKEKALFNARQVIINKREYLGMYDRMLNNYLLKEMPIINLFTHGAYDKGNQKFNTKLNVDIKFISGAQIGLPYNRLNNDEKKEYIKIIDKLKFSSFLNEATQKKQIDVGISELRELHRKMMNSRYTFFVEGHQDYIETKKKIEE